ncbi:MAG TPA: glycosyltransferase N-terminal domain-containing protein [Cyclobacteriaceae bacterium]|jgi:3-deoxy-D-manno-octulosonic-acid transferase|nr:glycosyltransferase N-terminal domain-containing protein [Cyclobacteriaceae bacterium]
MQQFLYTLSIHALRLGFILAAPINQKARQFVMGRKGIFKKLAAAFSEKKIDKLVWIHCASLGEFEQGRPIIEALKAKLPQIKVLLTFFSPSGYEVQKNYAVADFIFYLPWDTPKQAAQFVAITRPDMAIFIKYEFWYHYTASLKKSGSNIVSASCILRPDQIFFKSYGSLFRKLLQNFDFFFTQNSETKKLLASISINNSKVAGDTRFDRVMEIIKKGSEIEQAKKFKNGQKLFVVGSCWPEDLDVLAPFINENNNTLKFIIAPHEISNSFISEIEKSLHVKTARFSEEKPGIEDCSVLIIDNIGMLSRLYRYGEFAFVGGAFGKGLHNILEAACYGIPVFFGNKNYDKYKEANDLIMRGGAFEVSGYSDLKANYELMIDRPENFLLACEVTRSYVEENLGATKKIMDHCIPILSK